MRSFRKFGYLTFFSMPIHADFLILLNLSTTMTLRAFRMGIMEVCFHSEALSGD
jgi:hypothetical protein